MAEGQRSSVFVKCVGVASIAISVISVSFSAEQSEQWEVDYICFYSDPLHLRLSALLSPHFITFCSRARALERRRTNGRTPQSVVHGNALSLSAFSADIKRPRANRGGRKEGRKGGRSDADRIEAAATAAQGLSVHHQGCQLPRSCRYRSGLRSTLHWICWTNCYQNLLYSWSVLILNPTPEEMYTLLNL